MIKAWKGLQKQGFWVECQFLSVQSNTCMPQQFIKIYKIFSLQIILSYNKETCNNFLKKETYNKRKDQISYKKQKGREERW